MANNSLEKARLEINEIDKQMAELFCRRIVIENGGDSSVSLVSC